MKGLRNAYNEWKEFCIDSLNYKLEHSVKDGGTHGIKSRQLQQLGQFP
jgi:hypothetical protein